ENGEGSAPEALARPLRRHATRKRKNQSDLFRIRTLGFRGEALPSIASLSHMIIETETAHTAHIIHMHTKRVVIYKE
ncbi:DNA mismatch repair protein MutL, partial [Streptococcus suis]